MTLTIEQIDAFANSLDEELVDEICALAKRGVTTMLRPIDEAPEGGGNMLLVFGGSFTWDSHSYDQEYMPFTLGRVAEVCFFDKERQAWQGSRTDSHDCYYWHKPTHFIPLTALEAP